jgi:hypothetical protein
MYVTQSLMQHKEVNQGLINVIRSWLNYKKVNKRLIKL